MAVIQKSVLPRTRLLAIFGAAIAALAILISPAAGQNDAAPTGESVEVLVTTSGVLVWDEGVQDLTPALRSLELPIQDDEMTWLGLEVTAGGTTKTRMLVLSPSRLFGAGMGGFGRRLDEAPTIIRLVGPEGASAGIPHTVRRVANGWATQLTLPANETVRIAIGTVGGEMPLAVALATEGAVAASAALETRLRGLLFGASLMLLALLLAQGVLTGRGLYFSGFTLAFGLSLYVATSAGWHSGIIDSAAPQFGGAKAAALMVFLIAGLDFARRAMKLRDLSPGPNRIALGLIVLALAIGGGAFVIPGLVPISAPFVVLATLLSGIVIVEGTRQNVEGPKLLLGPWMLFTLACLMVAGLSLLGAPRFGTSAALLVQALLVAATLAATLSIDRLTAPVVGVQGMTPTQDKNLVRGADHRIALAVSGARKGVWDWKIHGDRLYLSGGAMALLGFEAQGGEGSEEAFFGRVHSEDQEAYREKLRAEVDRGNGHFSHDMRVMSESGEYNWLRLEAEVTGGTTQTGARIVGLLSDVSLQHNRSRRNQDEGLRDPLTGLPSRGLFMDHIAHAIEHPQSSLPPALIVMDVDRFEAINDGVGHAGGDTMLIVLARRLEGVLPKGAFAARLGGDEFGVLVEEHAVPDQVLDLCETIRDILSEPLEIGGEEIFPSLSFGIAFGDTQNEANEPMLRRAEIAMYHGKRSGGSRIETFRPEFAKRKGELMSLETGLNRALERREVELLYQPIMSVADGRLAGFEALMRWNHPEHGLLSPDRFLSLAEDTGAIVPLGRYVVEAAATQLMAWQTVYKRQDPLFVGVNLSARQILHHDLARDVERVLNRMKLARRSLIVEVTESVVMENPELAERRLFALAAEGLGLALDDFGTGYSSLSHLARFAFNKLKIDRAFIEGMTDDADTRTIVRAIISLAKDLGQDVVAEGVQTEEQLRILKEFDCDLAQGYLFGKPMTAAEAERLIINDKKPQIISDDAADQARPASPDN